MAVLLALALGNGLSALSGIPGTNTLTAESFLQGSPTIAEAVYEKELLLPQLGIPEGARKQTFIIKRDGTNYFCSSNGIHNGRFNGIFWSDFGQHLVLHDPKINKEQAPMGRLTRWNVDVAANLGFPEIDKDVEVTWDRPRNRLLATMTESGAEGQGSAPPSKEGRLVIHLTYDDGILVSARAEDASTGQPQGLVLYKYSTNFWQGTFPVEFTRFVGPVPRQEARLYTIRFLGLELSNKSLPDANMDPLQMFSSTSLSPIIHSIDVAYEVLNGQLHRIPTMEENQARLVKAALTRGRLLTAAERWCYPHGRISVPRIVALGGCLILVCGVVVLIWSWMSVERDQ